jgi:acylphosphatase
MRATRLLIAGIVQGVGFRFFAERAGRELGLRGYVRNLPDGRVEAVAAGPEDDLREFTERLRRGPRASKVDRLETSEADLPDDQAGFEIRD